MSKRTVVKQGKHFKLFSDGLIKIENVRMSYLHVDKPYAGDDGGEPKYSVVGIMPKATHKEAQAFLIEQINAVCKEKKWWKVEDGKGRRTIPSDKLCIKNGDDSGKDEYANAWTLSAREKTRPILRDKTNRSVDESRINDVFYSGCWGNIVIKLWAQDNKYGKRVNANLSMVQFVKDDTAFGEGRLSDDDADDILDAADDGDDGLGGDDDDDDL